MLELELYAQARAHLAFFSHTSQEEVLEQLGISNRLWQVSDSHWLTQLMADADCPTGPVALAFAVPFADQRRELDKQQPTLASIRPLVSRNDARALANVDETAIAHRGSFADRTLPFVSSKGVTLLDRPSELDITAHDAAGATGFFVAHGDPTLPFHTNTEDVRFNPGSLVEFASVSAALESATLPRSEVLAEYGTDEQGYARLSEYWNARFREGSQDQVRYEELLQTYRGWLGTGKGRNRGPL